MLLCYLQQFILSFKNETAGKRHHPKGFMSAHHVEPNHAYYILKMNHEIICGKINVEQL